MFKKILLRSLLALLIFNLVFVALVTIIASIYKNELKEKVLSEINTKLHKPIVIKDFSLSALTNFPGLTMSLHEVHVSKKDSSEIALVQLEEIQVVLNVFEFITGKVVVSKIELQNGSLDMRVDADGKEDFKIWRTSEDHKDTLKPKGKPVELNKIILKNVSFFYKNDFKPKKINLLFQYVKSSLVINEKDIQGTLNGFILSNELTLKPGTFFKDASLGVDINFNINKADKLFSFKESTVESKQDKYIANGSVDFRNDPILNLHIKSENADINTLFSLLPHRWSKNLDSLQLSGHVTTSALIKVNLKPGNKPNINIDFSSSDLELTKQGIDKRVHDLHFKGNLTSTDSLEMEYYAMSLYNLEGKIGDQGRIKASEIKLKNFIRPTIKAALDISINTKDFLDIVKFKRYDNISGSINVKIMYDGYLNYMTGKEATLPVMNGSVQLKGVNLKLKRLNFEFSKMNGTVSFKNDTINAQELSVHCGKTDMKISGIAYHLFESVFRDTTGLKMNINLNSSNFYYADFHAKSHPKKQTDQDKPKKNIKVVHRHIILPYDLQAVIKGSVKNFYASNYRSQNVELTADLSAERILIKEQMNTFGGSMALQNTITPNGTNGLNYDTYVTLRKVNIDKVFAAFDNFGQSFITSKKVKGELSGDFRLFFKTDASFKMDTASTRMQGTYSIRKVELKNVEPLMKLAKLGFAESDLSNITCDEIKSELTITGNHIVIPRTLLVTNILYFYTQVSLTLGGEVEILSFIPVKNLKKKPNTDELTNDSQAGLSIPLRISGKAGALKVVLISKK